MLSALVLPKLDYCNSFFYSSPMYTLERLQKVQNSATRLIVQCRKQNHISLPLLMPLHRQCQHRIQTLSFLSFFFYTCLNYSQCIHRKETYSLLLTMEVYVSISCEQRHLGIAHFLLQPPQYGILCLQNSDIKIPSRKLNQH